MRELTASDRIALHMGQAVLIENACQQVVDAVEGIERYELHDAEVIELHGTKHAISGRAAFVTASGFKVLIPFLGEIPPAVRRETVEGVIAQVKAGLEQVHG